MTEERFHECGSDDGMLAEESELLRRQVALAVEPVVVEQAHAGVVNQPDHARVLDLLSRVRTSYLRQAGAAGWFVVDGNRDRSVIADDIAGLVVPRVLEAAATSSGSGDR